MNYGTDILESIPSPQGITDADYEAVAPMIEAVRTVARVTYQGVFVADLYRNNFLYVSDSPLTLMGHQPEEVKEKGYRFLIEKSPQDEQGMMAEFVSALFRTHHEKD